MPPAVPEFQPGDTLIVNVKVKEGERTRVQAYEGVCIARTGGGLNESFTVRKISYGEGVERVFPVYSPNIDSIKVLRRGKVRRAKLYYLRDRRGKAARIAERVESPEAKAAREAANAQATAVKKGPRPEKSKGAIRAAKGGGKADIPAAPRAQASAQRRVERSSDGRTDRGRSRASYPRNYWSGSSRFAAEPGRPLEDRSTSSAVSNSRLTETHIGSLGIGTRVLPNSGKASASMIEPPLIVSSQCMIRSPSSAGISACCLRRRRSYKRRSPPRRARR